MATYIPNGNVTVYNNVPIIKNKHQKDFNNLTSQTNYFTGYLKEKDVETNIVSANNGVGTVKVHCRYDDIQGCNYISFVNNWDNKGDKIYYGFIKDVRYCAPNVSFIDYEIDDFQTFMFDYEITETFVEREHCNRWQSNGKPVVNTVEENLFIGNAYKVHHLAYKEVVSDTFFMVVVTNKEIQQPIDDGVNNGVVFGGVTSQLHYYIFPTDNTKTEIYINDVRLISKDRFFSKMFSDTTFVNTVVDIMFTHCLPIYISRTSSNATQSKYFAQNIQISPLKGSDQTDYIAKIGLAFENQYQTTPQHSWVYNLQLFQDVYSVLPNYTESKMLMYPYTYLEVMDFLGNKMDVHLEEVNKIYDGKAINSKIVSGLSSSSQSIMQIYGNIESEEHKTSNFDNSLITVFTSQSPVLTEFTASHIQGSKNALTTQLVGGIGGVLFGTGLALTGNVPFGVAGILGGVSAIASTIGGIKDMDNVPPNVKLTSSNPFINFGNNKFGYTLAIKTVSNEHASKIQGFFKMFGYKVNEIKNPNLKSRKNFNYIKTIDCNIVGEINDRVKENLIAMYDDGITIWHTNILDYNVNNNEV